MQDENLSISDLTDAQWEILKPNPSESRMLTHVIYERRNHGTVPLRICAGRCRELMPHDLPPGDGILVLSHVAQQKVSGITCLHSHLANRCGTSKTERLSQIAAVIDGQSGKTSAVRGPKG